MTTTAVPTIRDTIVSTLRANGYGNYAAQPVIDQIVAALVDREAMLHQVQTGVQMPAEQVEQQGNVTTGAFGSMPSDPTVEQRVGQLEEHVTSLIQFAQANGYRA